MGKNVTFARNGREENKHISLPRHEQLDLGLQQRARNITREFIEFSEMAIEFIASEYYLLFRDAHGQPYLGAAPYFTDRIGIAYRSVRRLLAVVEGLRRLPDAERESATLALAEVGTAKAGVLAPILGRDGQDWRTWVEQARQSGVEALQGAVSTATGAKPRGPAHPGGRLLRYLLDQMPDEAAREEVEMLFEAVFELTGSDNGVNAFLMILAEAKGGVLQQLAAKRRGVPS